MEAGYNIKVTVSDKVAVGEIKQLKIIILRYCNVIKNT